MGNFLSGSFLGLAQRTTHRSAKEPIDTYRDAVDNFIGVYKSRANYYSDSISLYERMMDLQRSCPRPDDPMTFIKGIAAMDPNTIQIQNGKAPGFVTGPFLIKQAQLVLQAYDALPDNIKTPALWHLPQPSNIMKNLQFLHDAVIEQDRELAMS